MTTNLDLVNARLALHEAQKQAKHTEHWVLICREWQAIYDRGRNADIPALDKGPDRASDGGDDPR